jgi:hypothetical protein
MCITLNHSFITELSDSTMSPNLDISRVGTRILEELVSIMKEIKLDDSELACIKALVFFDPSKFFFSILSNFDLRYIFYKTTTNCDFFKSP